MLESNLNTIFKKIFPNGKTSTKPGEITSQYVTAVCRVYENRSNTETEFVIEEYGIIERSAYDSLAACYVDASKTAYKNMLARISELSGLSCQESITNEPADVKKQVVTPQASAIQEPIKADAVVVNIPKTESVVEAGTYDNGSDDPVEPFGEEALQSQSTVHKLDLSLGLQPASSLGGEKQVPAEDDEIAKARSMPITIVGKAHDCYNWTAGKILDELPEVIVNFTPRYSGEKKEEKAALMALYPEAMRRCKQSA